MTMQKSETSNRRQQNNKVSKKAAMGHVNK